jgi:hypothetical protein
LTAAEQLDERFHYEWTAAKAMTSAAVDLVDAAADGFHDGTVPMVAAVVEWAKDGWTVTTSVQVARLLLLCSWPWLLFILIGDAWWTDKGQKRVETAAIKVPKEPLSPSKPHAFSTWLPWMERHLLNI